MGEEAAVITVGYVQGRDMPELLGWKGRVLEGETAKVIIARV